MLRFTTKTNKNRYKKSKGYLALLITPAVLFFFLFMIQSVNDSTIERQKESLSNAISRDIIHCYAIEGYYPPSLDYLKEHYGLSYDEDLFLVDYQPIGSNLRPNVTILER